MLIRRCRVLAALTGLFLAVSSTHALAWEFILKGSFNWTYEWYNQMGSRGFFGDYNVDLSGEDGSATRTWNLNFWNGGRFDTNFVSGANAGWSYFNVQFQPEIRINQAIRMRAALRLGTWGEPASSDYQTQNAPGAQNAFSQGQWTLFWITANTPWGVFGVGKRPWTFGTGLQYDGSDSASTESLVLSIPYGPFDIGLAFYPYRFAGDSHILIPTDTLRNALAYGDPYDLPLYNGGTVTGQYYSRADRSASFLMDFLGFASYSNGPIQVGILGSVGAYHVGPEALLRRDPSPSSLVPLDSQLFHGTAFVQYNNGSFFLNSEWAWLYWTDRYWGNGNQDASESVYPPYTRYIEQWRAMLEMGVFAGPAKLSLITAWSPGPDRRAGRYIDRQSAAFIWHPTYDTHLGNYSVFRPYSYLFCYDYGSGLNAYNLSGDGYLRDAFVLAARLDYAVASNFNVFGTFFWAQRTSQGYAWGSLRPNHSAVQGTVVDGNIDFSQISPGPLNIPESRMSVPNITERALGYEVNLGVDWQLLEGWQLGAVFGCWVPGAWFNFACIDRSDPNWADLSFPGARPLRKIDAVIGGQFSMKFMF